MSDEVQLIVSYEDEPYLIANDVPVDDFQRALQSNLPPDFRKDWTGAEINPWQSKLHTDIRSELILIRDHADEIALDDGRRNKLVQNVLTVLIAMLALKGETIEKFASVMINYFARQSSIDADRPAFEVAFGLEVVPLHVIRTMSTTSHFTMIAPDGTAKEIRAIPQLDRKRTLLEMNGFWRSNQPGGVSVLMQSEKISEIAELVLEMSATIPNTEAATKDCFEILQEKTDQSFMAMVAAVIHHLEIIGAIPTNQWNGIQYIYDDPQVI